MTPQTIIFQGAEAKIFLDEKKDFVIKDRIKKSYRIKELDDKIRKQRTKSEMKLLIKASNIINTPKVLDVYESSQNNQLKISFINGKKLSSNLDEFSLAKQKKIINQIGIDVAKLHDNHIIHGDLTTSNMILVKDSNGKKLDDIKKAKNKIISKQDLTLTTSYQSTNKASSNFKVYFIDFGLGFISNKLEDKAVDIHLLKQALEAKHFRHWEVLFKEFLKGYKTSKDSKKVLQQLEKVEKRGRYKDKN